MELNLSYALQITLIGMSLVFGAILLLWVVMIVMVRLTADTQPVAETPATEPNSDEVLILKQRAAAVAVAVALAQQQNQTELHTFPLPPTALVSAWQAVMRSSQLRQRGPIR